MTAVFRALTLLCLFFGLLTSCASLRREFVDPSFKTQGLKNSVVTLKCTAPPGMPFGLAPQDEREILDDARLGILARYKNVQIVPETRGEGGGVKPTYSFVVYVVSDETEQKVKRYRGARAVGAGRSVYLNVTRARIRRTANARYTVIHVPTEKIVWQASGKNSRSERHRLNLVGFYGRLELRPNLGPPLPNILTPLTEKACRKLP
ncbi:MAG: hypothetical protein V4662_25745 [Verrucomicrobiota bacterium]